MRLKLKTISILVLLLLLAACITPKLNREELNAGERYVVSRNGQDYFSFVAQEGRWQAYPDWEKRGSLRLYGSDYDFLGIAYQSRVFMQNLEKSSQRPWRLYELQTQDYQGSIDNYLKDFYNLEHREDVKIEGVETSVKQVAGLTCVYFLEYQNYMADNKVMFVDYSCPLIINGEVWEFGIFYRISVYDSQLIKFYGDDAPSYEEIMEKHEARLKPLYDSIVLFHNPTQTLPVDYRE